MAALCFHVDIVIFFVKIVKIFSDDNVEYDGALSITL